MRCSPRSEGVSTRLRDPNETDPGHVVLLSGGVESSTLLRLAFARDSRIARGGTPGRIIPLFFDYGQRGAKREKAAAAAQCGALGIADIVELDMTAVGETLRRRQTKRLHVPIIHRNLTLLSLAVSVAAQERASRISIAISADDQGWYPSASTEFLAQMQRAVSYLEPGLELCTPLIEMSKAEVVELGLELGVPFDATWSCMLKRARHCGRCVQCRARKEAFAQCGQSEGLDFYER